MAYCTNCGHELADGVHFCTNCGRALDSAAPPTTDEGPPSPAPPVPAASPSRGPERPSFLSGRAPVLYAVVAIALLALVLLLFLWSRDASPADAGSVAEGSNAGAVAAPVTPGAPADAAAIALAPTATPTATPIPTPPIPSPTPVPSPAPPAPTPTPTTSAAASRASGKESPAKPSPSPTAIPATQTPTASPTPSPTPGIWGIAVAEDAASARQQLGSGAAAGPLTPGSKPHAALTIGGFGFGTRITYVWELGDRTIEGSHDTRTETDRLEIAADIEPGLPGGGYALRLMVGESELLRHEFQVEAENVHFGAVEFAENLDLAGAPVGPTHDFIRGTRQVQAVVWGYNVPTGSVIAVSWTVNGVVVATSELPWPVESSGPGSARQLVFPSPTTPGGLAAGDHRFVIELNGVEVVNDVFRVG